MVDQVFCSGRHRGGKCSGDTCERFSLDLPAGTWCEAHWATSGYRKEGREGFDPADAGETYEPDDWGGDDSW